LVDSQDDEKRNREFESIREVTAAQRTAASREDRSTEDGRRDEGQRQEQQVEEGMLRDFPAATSSPIPRGRGIERRGGRGRRLLHELTLPDSDLSSGPGH